MSLSSEDIYKIEEKIRNGSDDGADAKTQNNPLANGVVLTNTCENCGTGFVPKNSMTWEIQCNVCIRKKQNVTEMGELPK
jgi:uncharacterized Zn finger protein (UPF0148 family)